MKNQYFGDVNDYIKYSILRRLAGEGLKVGVCWMMTPPDNGKDGRKLGYLDRRPVWGDLDGPLFDFLSKARDESPRGVHLIEKSPLLRGAEFFREIISDVPEEREGALDGCLSRFSGCDVVFFDPDNGMEISSKPPGRKGFNKYLAWGEARRFFSAGLSIAIYQHFPRQPREEFLEGFRRRLQAESGTRKTFIIRSPHVAFCLAAQKGHSMQVDRALREFGGEGIGRTRMIPG